ncbi:MAG: bi-domain-containing oxidoreductase [Anaerolineae bacterium]|nr:bi-domain-containing oxidoreductase [Anaerolineae bacterium]
MKQVFFDGKGKLLVQDVPAPAAPANGALVRVYASLISSGTEMTAASGGGSLIKKALEQPQLIGRAIQLALREGIKFTAGQVQDISESWFPVGYSAAGMIIEPGRESGNFQAGDRVACSGAGFANHAEVDAVPQNLLATIPDGVAYKQAAFTSVGSIALQGVRRAEVSLGETVVVVGLGLIGQITTQLLDAAGCLVIGSDPVGERRELAAKLSGAQTIDPTLGDASAQVMALTGGLGADKVILCAATKSSSPTNEAFKMCRERGRVVMVGAMGMDIERTEFYNRELDFVISRSTGPGRYDRDYEERGIDYPYGLVRWTEQRNMAAFLQLVADGKLDLDSLITAEFPVEQAGEAYQAVQEGAVGVLLTYGEPTAEGVPAVEKVLVRASTPKRGKIGLALVGAGNFAKAVHLPNIKKSEFFDLQAVISDGVSAAQVAEKTGAKIATTDLDAALVDPDVDVVLIATRHHLHAGQTIRALRAGKHVLVEKPMALTVADCRAMIEAAQEAGVLLTVDFNRRMAPTAQALKAALDQIGGPKTVIFRVNAGPLAASHWLNDLNEGGGRLLGEGVHFVDFVAGMIGGDPLTVSAQGSLDGQDFVITMRFVDDSLGVVAYTGRGDPAFPKERVEAFAGGGVAVLDDFKTLAFSRMHGQPIRGGADKGHRALLENFGAAIQGKAALGVSGLDGLRATRIALVARESMRGGETIDMRAWQESPAADPDSGGS